MIKKILKLRTVIAIAICLATTTVFASSKEEDASADSGADIVAFTFQGIVGKAVINTNTLTVTATADDNVNLEYVHSKLTVSKGATARDDNMVMDLNLLLSLDCTGTVIITVTSSDKRLTNVWKIIVKKDNADIIAFTFAGIVGKAVIDKKTLTVTATAEEKVDLWSVFSELTVSKGATARMDNMVMDLNAVWALDCTGPVIVTVTSSDKKLTNVWKIIVKKDGKKYFTYNKPVKAYYIEYNGGAIAANRNSKAGKAGTVIEAYENKKYVYVWWNDAHMCYLTYPNGDYYQTVYGSAEWLAEKKSNGMGNEDWVKKELWRYKEYPLGAFAFWVSKTSLGTFVFETQGGRTELADLGVNPALGTMPNQQDVTKWYLRSEKLMNIMCDVYKINRDGSVTFWVDPATGFTLKLEVRNAQGKLEEDVSYEVTRLVSGKTNWSSTHLHPLPADIVREP